MKDNYDDIIDLPHHTSPTRKKMSLYDRAAQFASFSALVGYDDVVEETARLTDKKIQLDEYEMERINNALLLLSSSESCPGFTVTYFVPDDKKDGGKYITTKAKFKKLNRFEKKLILADGVEIPFDNIMQIYFDE